MKKSILEVVKRLEAISPVINDSCEPIFKNAGQDIKWLIADTSETAKKIIATLRKDKPFHCTATYSGDWQVRHLTLDNRQYLLDVLAKTDDFGVGKNGLIVCSESVYNDVKPVSLRHRETRTPVHLYAALPSIADDYLELRINHGGVWNDKELKKLNLPAYSDNIFRHQKIRSFENIVVFDYDLASAIYAAYAYHAIRDVYGITPKVFVLNEVMNNLNYKNETICNFLVEFGVEIVQNFTMSLPSLYEYISNVLIIAPQYLSLHLTDGVKKRQDISFYTIPYEKMIVSSPKQLLGSLCYMVRILVYQNKQKFLTNMWKHCFIDIDSALEELPKIDVPSTIEKLLKEHSSKIKQLFI